MGHFLGIFLITCIVIILSVENVSSIKWYRRYSLGKEPSLVYGDEDVVGGYNFGRSRFFNPYNFRYDSKSILSKSASSKNLLNSDVGEPSFINSSDTKNNTAENVSESTISIVQIVTKKGLNETTDFDIHSSDMEDPSGKLKYTIVDATNKDNNPSSSTAAVTVSTTEFKDPTKAVTEPVTNLKSTTTQKSASESVLKDSSTPSNESVTNMKDTTTDSIVSETTGITESVTKISNTITDMVSNTDLSDTTSKNTASETGISNTISTENTSKSNPSTAAITENPQQSSTTDGSTSQVPSEKTSHVPEASKSDTDLTQAPPSQSSTSTENLTENPLQSSTTDGSTSQAPSEKTSNVPETSQSYTDATETRPSQSSTSTENIISSTVTQSVSSTTDKNDETSTFHPTTAPNWNRIKVAVSVLFVIIAVMSLGVLGTYIIRAKRETIQYDELTLLP